MILEQQTFILKNKGLIIMRRAGVGFMCTPQINLSTIKDYKFFEICFMFQSNYVNSVGKLSDYIDQFGLVDPMFYETSTFDNLLCSPYCCDKDYEHIIDTIEKCQKLENDGKGFDIIKQPPKKGAICRCCNEFNEWAESDMLTIDNEYTCWGCGTHPSRYSVGLTTVEQFDAIKKIYKNKGFWNK